MKFKKSAKQIESFLEEELRKKSPLLVLPNDDLVYKIYRIKKNKLGLWELRYATGDLIYTFRLRATAALAAKYYDNVEFQKFNEIKIIDTQYWNNTNDSVFFKHRFKYAKELDKRDLYLSRWEITAYRAKYYRDEITRKFKLSF